MSDEQDRGRSQRDWAREIFAIQRSIKYHTRRQAFYDGWNNATNAVSILLGAGTVAALAHDVPFAGVLTILFPVLITVFATFNLDWGSTRRARLHNDLYRRFVDLERRMISLTAIDEPDCRTLRAERLAIEADEPPTMFVVSVLCHNEVVRANGAGEHFKVPAWQKWLAHYWAFPNATFAPAKRTAT